MRKKGAQSGNVEPLQLLSAQEIEDEAEWNDIEQEALSSDRIDLIATYLRESGQASA
jgi:hypothetical protein